MVAGHSSLVIPQVFVGARLERDGLAVRQGRLGAPRVPSRYRVDPVNEQATGSRGLLARVRKSDAFVVRFNTDRTEPHLAGRAGAVNRDFSSCSARALQSR
jgi:hypothetical protein